MLYVGRTYSINVKGGYKWYSTNKRIVRVNSKTKKITPRKAGTTYIKGVKKVHNKKIVKKIKVIVKKPYLNKKEGDCNCGKETDTETERYGSYPLDIVQQKNCYSILVRCCLRPGKAEQ